MKNVEMFDPSHPGEILLANYVKPLELDVATLSGTSPGFFLRLQQQYDLACARREFDKIEKDIPVLYRQGTLLRR